jgi:hypothetical protein
MVTFTVGGVLGVCGGWFLAAPEPAKTAPPCASLPAQTGTQSPRAVAIEEEGSTPAAHANPLAAGPTKRGESNPQAKPGPAAPGRVALSPPQTSSPAPAVVVPNLRGLDLKAGLERLTSLHSAMASVEEDWRFNLCMAATDSPGDHADHYNDEATKRLRKRLKKASLLRLKQLVLSGLEQLTLTTKNLLLRLHDEDDEKSLCAEGLSLLSDYPELIFEAFRGAGWNPPRPTLHARCSNHYVEACHAVGQLESARQLLLARAREDTGGADLNALSYLDPSKALALLRDGRKLENAGALAHFADLARERKEGDAFDLALRAYAIDHGRVPHTAGDLDQLRRLEELARARPLEKNIHLALLRSYHALKRPRALAAAARALVDRKPESALWLRDAVRGLGKQLALDLLKRGFKLMPYNYKLLLPLFAGGHFVFVLREFAREAREGRSPAPHLVSLLTDRVGSQKKAKVISECLPLLRDLGVTSERMHELAKKLEKRGLKALAKRARS